MEMFIVKEVELPEELLRGRAGFGKDALYTGRVAAAKVNHPAHLTNSDRKRLKTRRRIEDIQAERELEREINSF